MTYFKAKRKSLSEWKAWIDKQSSGERGISRSIIADWQSSEDALRSENERYKTALEELNTEFVRWGSAADIMRLSYIVSQTLNGGK